MSVTYNRMLLIKNLHTTIQDAVNFQDLSQIIFYLNQVIFWKIYTFQQNTKELFIEMSNMSSL